MATVAVLGTLDTKGTEYDWIRRLLEGHGCAVHLIDVGVLGEPTIAADTAREAVAEAAGTSIAELTAGSDRGAALTAMARGAAVVVGDLARAGRIDAFLAMGGSGGSSVAAAAMQALPVGFPKLLVSTMASGDVAPYVGATDVTLMYSVVDIAGINRLSRSILGNAAAAIAGMAKSREAGAGAETGAETDGDRPLVGASMFGVTTPAVDVARARLEDAGYEVLVFHATGSGGRALEQLAASGYLAGVLDLTTTELADEEVGGVLTAGPDRATAAGRAGVPQVVGVGALDMVNFGPLDTVPAPFADRNLYVHNPTVTLMRTTERENRAIGAALARKLADAEGPTILVLPLRGVSALDREGAQFADPIADRALFDALREGLHGSAVQVIEHDLHINDPEFATAAADALLGAMERPTRGEETADGGE